MSDGKSRGADPFTVNPEAINPFTIHLKGRMCWALQAQHGEAA